MSAIARKPLVACLCRVPMIFEALVAELDEFATVQRFPAAQGETLGLLRSIAPDGVVIDSAADAAAAEEFARETGSPVVHVEHDANRVRVLRDGKWEAPRGSETSAASIRNALVGGIYTKGRKR